MFRLANARSTWQWRGFFVLIYGFILRCVILSEKIPKEFWSRRILDLTEDEVFVVGQMSISFHFLKESVRRRPRELSKWKFTLKFNSLFCMVIPYYVVISNLYFYFILRGRMKGISISPHILPLKPHPFTPLKRLGIPQTQVEADGKLEAFLLVSYGTIVWSNHTSYCHSERKNLRSKFWSRRISKQCKCLRSKMFCKITTLKSTLSK